MSIMLIALNIRKLSLLCFVKYKIVPLNLLNKIRSFQ